jgi:tetratricopeptide (TPR) repeat protein
MTQHFSTPRARAALTIASLVIVVGCVGGGGRRPIAVPGATPTATAGAAAETRSLQGLYESGRYREVLNSVNAGDGSAQALWFAAQSSLRLGQRDEAARQFSELPQVGGNPAWQTVSDLALALLRDNPAETDRAREAAAGFPNDPIVQYELGLAHARRNDMAAAAQAFDRATQADPRFAYAYYSGGLAYDRLNRSDLVIARLEMFERLAPEAPERPEVTSILQTVRGR